MIKCSTKLAAEVWNVGVDFTAQLQPGETITSGFAELVSGSVTVTFVSVTGNIATATVAGGTSEAISVVQIGINTSAGEVLAENLSIPVS